MKFVECTLWRMLWSKALLFEFLLLASYLPWAGLGWGPGWTCDLTFLFRFLLLLLFFFFPSIMGIASRTSLDLALDVTSCQLPAAGVFFSVLDASRNRLCPLAANTRELGDRAGCRPFLFQPLIAIVLPVIC